MQVSRLTSFTRTVGNAGRGFTLAFFLSVSLSGTAIATQQIQGCPATPTAGCDTSTEQAEISLKSVESGSGIGGSGTVSIFPDSPTVNNCIPFGRSTENPFRGFIYQNVPAFSAQIGDTLAFDLGNVNDNDIQYQIDLASTTVNGGEVADLPFTTVVSNTQVPLNPRGNTTVGDFELQFTFEAPFSFPGGGLIIRFSSPGGAFASDTTCEQVLVWGDPTDSSGFFVKRFFSDADGLSPYSSGAGLTTVGAFQVIASGGGLSSSEGDIQFEKTVVDPYDLSEPTEGSDYLLCLFLDGSLVGEWTAPGTEFDNFDFEPKKEVRYKNKKNGDGLHELKIQSGDGNGNLEAEFENGPMLPLGVYGSVTAQFHNYDGCWSNTWPASSIERDTSGQFKAKSKD